MPCAPSRSGFSKRDAMRLSPNQWTFGCCRRKWNDGWELRGPLHLFRQDNRFGDFLHRLAPLAALLLQQVIGLAFADVERSLQNPFGALHQFARFEPRGQFTDLALESRTFHFCPYKESDCRHEADLFLGMPMRQPMLQSDHAYRLSA